MSRPCPICETDNKKVLFNQKFSKNSITPMVGYDVVLCKDCGFAFADNIPDQKAFNEYYEKMSKYEVDYTDELHQEKIYNFLRPYCKDKAIKILDIGCSTGGLLSLFKAEGFKNICGVDPSPQCCKIVSSKGIGCIKGTVSAIPEHQRYDLIILSSVIEHLIDINEAMKKIKKLLKPFGLLFIEVPNCTRFHKHIHVPFQQFSIEHINYFSHGSLQNITSKHGFEKLNLFNEVNETTQMKDPCIFWLGYNREFRAVKDTATIENLPIYVQNSHKLRNEIKETLKQKLDGKEKVIIWGVGTHTQILLNEMNLEQVAFFTDSNERYKGQLVAGIKIIMPHNIKADYPILISSWSYQDEIERKIRKLKLKNEVIKLYE